MVIGHQVLWLYQTPSLSTASVVHQFVFVCPILELLLMEEILQLPINWCRMIFQQQQCWFVVVGIGGVKNQTCEICSNGRCEIFGNATGVTRSKEVKLGGEKLFLQWRGREGQVFLLFFWHLEVVFPMRIWVWPKWLIETVLVLFIKEKSHHKTYHTNSYIYIYNVTKATPE